MDSPADSSPPADGRSPADSRSPANGSSPADGAADAAGADGTRLAGYANVATTLSLYSDRRLGELVDAATPLGTGIGGATMLLDVGGIPVFAKRVPLTELERRPENIRSTANVFQLPSCCHYGVGSAGGGVWRELAAHIMSTNWVLGRQTESFPLLYHWRVLAGPAPRTPTAQDEAELTGMVEYWHGSPAVRERLTAIARSSASVVLFLEYLPQNLHDWLLAALARGGDALESACAMVERNLRTEVSFMNSHGLLHFDAHFRNILTDGRRLYFTDFGLATSPRFELAPAELSFVEENWSHDGCYAVNQLVNWLVTALTRPAGPAQRNALIRDYTQANATQANATQGDAAQGDTTQGNATQGNATQGNATQGNATQGNATQGTIPASIGAVITRYAPIAVVMNDFYWRLHGESRLTRYPIEEIQRVCAATGFEPILRSAD